MTHDRSLALFCVLTVLNVAFAVLATAILAARGQLWQAAICSFTAAASSLVLLRGVYDAERQARWRQIEHERADAVARFPFRESPQLITITIATHKGGVGKTVTAMALAAAYARDGLATVLVDLDPQGHSTRGLGVDVDTDAADLARSARRPDATARGHSGRDADRPRTVPTY
jgi:Mrp family chromosome partitioning ATPase